MNFREQLVAANRILANEGVLDAYGHVSLRHPQRADRFLLGWARAPELIEDADVLEFNLDGSLAQQTDKVPYLERFIHGAIYEQRPEVMAVCHNHTPSILPFSISKTARLTPVIHTANVLGGEAPVWDIADEFGRDTNLLVVNIDQGRSLARTLGQGVLALMRGHGSVVVGPTIPALVSACVNMDKNARVLLQAIQLGEYVPLAPGELKREWTTAGQPAIPDRGWEAMVRRVGLSV
ncbi:MAG TPA: class II aldolase/adducin family protein [Chloroflexota bacterium]|jgi:HCOMODA/2-hydroxy-3-carboxy-muconic semialdehyde decarboxylase|nr:class II aldolase/adducin family protein [Chloroflexota bacterium]